MPTAAQAQAVNDFVAQPINNLIVFAVIIALVIVLAVFFSVWKFAPALYKLYKEQAETNAKLTQIVGQNSDQAALATQSVDKNTAEMVKQTAAIEAQTTIITSQSLDLRNYQTLVSDNLSNHSAQIEANTAHIAALKAAIEALPAQLREVIDDKLFCAGIEHTINQMRDEVLTFIHAEQAKRSATAPEASDAQPG